MASQWKKACCESNRQFLLPVKHQSVGYPLEETGYASVDPASQHVDHNAGDAKGKICELLVLFAYWLAGCAIACPLVWWWTEGPDPIIRRYEFPVFRVDDVSVFEFNPPTPGISTAEWGVNLTVKNQRTGLRVFFQELAGSVYYREDDLFRDLVASVTSQLFITMETNSRTAMHMNFKANLTDIAEWETFILNKMGKDKNNGTVHFDLHFEIITTFDNQQKHWPWRRHATKKVNVHCDDIKVSFDGATGDGYATSRDHMNGPLFCSSY